MINIFLAFNVSYSSFSYFIVGYFSQITFSLEHLNNLKLGGMLI